MEINIPSVVKKEKNNMEVKINKDQEKAMEQAFELAKIRKANGKR